MPICSALTSGRELQCKDAVGGIRTIFFAQTLGALTIGADEIIDDIAATTVFKYELPNQTGNFTQTIQSSTENGTVFFEQTVTIKLNKLTATDRNEIKVLAQENLYIFVFDANNNLFLVGEENLAQLTAGDISTGQNRGDMNGYNLTFTAYERIPARYLTQSDSAFQGLTTPANITITS